MTDYMIGKDIERLEQRVAAIEQVIVDILGKKGQTDGKHTKTDV